VRIDLDTANRLFKCFDARKTVAQIEMFTGGRSTTNYKITLKETEQKFVLRLYPKNDRSWRKELALHNQLKGILPVPEILYLSEDRLIIEKPFSIVQFLEGQTLDSYAAANGPFPDSLARKIGEASAVIHQQQEYAREGIFDENLNVTDNGIPILSWWDHFLNGRAGERLDSGVRSKLVRFIKENQELLLQITERFVFSHGDFRPANLMVKDGKLIGIIDWEGALSAPPYFDIGQFIRYREQVPDRAKSSFIDAYNQNARYPVRANWEKLAKVMDLINLFCFLDSEQERPQLFADMRRLAAELVASFSGML
jgi:aminoglycoside phosphotransferase (APT) family kinase protein